MSVYCGLDGVRREGTQVSWDIGRFSFGPFVVYISFERRYCLTHIHSANAVHLDPKGLSIQEVALIFH